MIFLVVIILFLYINHNYDLNLGFSAMLTEKESEWLRQQDTIIYAADRNAPPLRFLDEADGQYKGVLIDYVNSLSLEIGTKIELHPMIWEEALDSLSEGTIDISDMFSSKERAKNYLFSKPIYNLRAVLAIRKGLDNVRSLNNLNGMTMAMQKGDYASGYLTLNYPGIKQILVGDLEEALLLVAEGKADATMGDEPVIFYQIDKNNLSSVISINEKPIYENQVVFAVSKSKPELIPILNKAIDALNRKNVLEKAQQKWFGISAPIVKAFDVEKTKGYIVIATIIVVALIIIMTYWNKSLKKEIQLRTKELEDSRNDLQIVFDGMTEYMLVLDKDRRIMNINTAFLKELKGVKQQVVGKIYKETLGKFSTIDLDDCIDKAFKEGTYTIEEKQFKNYIFEVNIHPLMDSELNINNVLILLYNITSEKISNNKLLQANKMAAIGELAAGIAHEIRNPLGLIRNHSFIIRNSELSNQNIDKSLDYIDSSVNRASKIIDNLLNFSRISGNNEDVVDLYIFIENILELQSRLIQKNNITFEIDCKKGYGVVINQESLKHILINLASNAVDAINNEGKIIVKAYQEDNNLNIECIDTGIGIPEEDLGRIFNPFYTTKEPGKGTGLGLYISYNEVRKLKGDISVVSKFGMGSIFKVNIPLKQGVYSNERSI